MQDTERQLDRMGRNRWRARQGGIPAPAGGCSDTWTATHRAGSPGSFTPTGPTNRPLRWRNSARPRGPSPGWPGTRRLAEHPTFRRWPTDSAWRRRRSSRRSIASHRRKRAQVRRDRAGLLVGVVRPRLKARRGTSLRVQRAKPQPCPERAYAGIAKDRAALRDGRRPGSAASRKTGTCSRPTWGCMSRRQRRRSRPAGAWRRPTTLAPPPSDSMGCRGPGRSADIQPASAGTGIRLRGGRGRSKAPRAAKRRAGRARTPPPPGAAPAFAA